MKWWHQALIVIVVVAAIAGGGYFAVRASSSRASKPLKPAEPTVIAKSSSAPEKRPPGVVQNTESPEAAELRKLREENERLRREAGAANRAVQAPPPAPPPITRFTLSGAAWITRQSGESDVLRGLSIVVLSPSLKKADIAAALDDQEAGHLDHREIYEKGLRDAKQGAKEHPDIYRESIKTYEKQIREVDAQIAALKRARAELPETMLATDAYAFLNKHAAFDVARIDVAAGSAVVCEVATNIDGKFSVELPAGDYFVMSILNAGKAGSAEWLVPVRLNANKIVDLHNATAIKIR